MTFLDVAAHGGQRRQVQEQEVRTVWPRLCPDAGDDFTASAHFLPSHDDPHAQPAGLSSVRGCPGHDGHRARVEGEGTGFTVSASPTHHSQPQWMWPPVSSEVGGQGSGVSRGSQAGVRGRPGSQAVVAVRVAADVPQDDVQDEEDGEDEQRDQQRLRHGRHQRLHGPAHRPRGDPRPRRDPGGAEKERKISEKQGKAEAGG